MDVHERLALNLRRLREAAGYTQEVFAEVANVNRTYVSDIERGLRNPTVDVIERCAVALRVKLGDLLDDPLSDKTQPKA